MSDLPYTTITVSGGDAFNFLQAQLAADLAEIANTDPSYVHSAKQESVALSPFILSGRSGQNDRVTVTDTILSAWCNPKGRVIALLRVAKRGDDYALILPTELAEEVIRRLTMFRFRAKVEFETHDATNEQLGIEETYEKWRLTNLHKGIPEILLAQSEEFTPHMLNLDLLGAVSVDKGCYPGQEIVARTHFRGATKRRLMRFECTEPVSPGDKVSDGERDVGEVLNAIGTDLLAVVPVEKADELLSIDANELLHFALPYQ